jgi:lipopolysaccharide transport system ATP-binding protein
MTDEIAIRADGLSKRYQLGTAGSAHDSLRDLLTSGIRAIVGGARSSVGSSKRPEFFALKDASFQIARGENVGVIGANGAGKSTLLKILSRIVEPTSGHATVRGRVGALLEVGTGFHGELTGRENTYLYGSILGMSHREIASKFDAIVEFAEVEKFIDTPVKRYSSGMYVRLAFSVAAHLRPDILLLDEVLAVGDAAFQRKCMNFARELQRQDATILFVSHNMFSIKTMCSRVIFIRAGTIEYDGPVDAGIELYEHGAHLSVMPWLKADTSSWPIVISEIELAGESGPPKVLFDHGERMTIRVHFKTREKVKAPHFMVAFVRSDGVGCSVYSNEMDDFHIDELEGDSFVEIRTPPIRLVAEKYVVHILIRRLGTMDLICAQIGRTFHVRHMELDTEYGVFHEQALWRLGAPASDTVDSDRS